MNFTEEYVVIESYLRFLLEKFKGEWKDNNTVEIFKDSKKIGTIKLNDKKVNVTGVNLIKEVEALVKLNEKNKPITDVEQKKSVFKNILDNQLKFNGLKDNFSIFIELDKQFKKIGINTVEMNKRYNRNHTIKKDLTVAIECFPQGEIAKQPPSGFQSRLKNLLVDKYKIKAATFSGVPSLSRIYPVDDEKIKSLTLKTGEEIGQYFIDRNLIHLYYNPFLIKKIMPLDFKVPVCLEDVLDALRTLKPKKIDSSIMENKLFIQAFMKNAENRIKSLSSNIRSNVRDMATYEKRIKDLVKQINEYQDEEEYLITYLKTGEKDVIKEIETTRKLSFIKDVQLKSSSLQITFIPAAITVPSFYRETHGKRYGKRTMYIGEITFDIGPGNFNVSGTVTLNNEYPHPHASGQNGSPCFGDGDGNKKIYELLAKNKFSELAKMLWFWIKTYRNSGAHLRMHKTYDSLLSQGYPVWDEKGKRIKLNDKERMKTGEQIKTYKDVNYETISKKYKDVKFKGGLIVFK
ncbi:hypothetical protein [Oceanihabitans sediminis]|uniref:hypothetical protein n=1 Tax=Oceanihabitans sediminis TaxID=1812012 RepID=UPI00299F061A|nr:hypothetical protein [Oceanihabitans sediminis]MDX1279244.1 hypothetical protein [Oceanihabitans sediminis]